MPKCVSVILFLLLQFHLYPQKVSNISKIWSPDNNDGTYKNPIIHADYSDPDVIRVNDDFYMTSSSFSNTPGLPILHSNDLVNWSIVNYAVQNIAYGSFDKPMHGNGIWAPSIRFHNGEYYIYYGDPDYGIFMTKTKNPLGKWEPLVLVKEAKGWIDPCPFWDEDGNAYLVHAWAKSRAGVKSILTLNKMNADGKSLLDEGINIFDGTNTQPTIEGPKLYKRNGYYYIFAPAGGVTDGWQTVLRSKNIYGPYDEKIVLERGVSDVNGPHQGGWVETRSGESWFIHFQDKGAYGRITHLEPMKWLNDWPIIGITGSKPDCGEPSYIHKKPDVGKKPPIVTPQTNDDFTSSKLGLQWQWEANSKPDWYSLKAKKGYLRLFCQTQETDSMRLWEMPYLLGQKMPAESFTVSTKIKFTGYSEGDRCGFGIMGKDYCFCSLVKTPDNRYFILLTQCKDADKGGHEITTDTIQANYNEVYFSIIVKPNARCLFRYSLDNEHYFVLGKSFTASKGVWIGARISFFATSRPGSKKNGFADIDYIKFTQNKE